MSMLSEFLGSTFGVGPDSPEAKAQDAVRRQVSQQQGQAKDIFSTFGQQRTDALGQARQDISSGFGGAQKRLGDFFGAQQGQANQLAQGILDQVRTQAAGSGLIGGSQEASLAQPLLQNLASRFATQGAQAQLGLEQQKLGAQQQLNVSNLGQLGGLQQQGLTGLFGSGQQATQAAGMFPRSILDQVAGTVGQVGGIASGIGSIAGLFGGGSAPASSKTTSGFGLDSSLKPFGNRPDYGFGGV